jgi:hypothetical protein
MDRVEARRSGGHRAVTGAAFYCISSEPYFLGAVAMLNSLRLHGNREPTYVLDCGLTPAQRELLARTATIVPAPTEDVSRPWLLKTAAPLAHPAEVMVLIDTDVIVIRPLTELLERAGDRVVAFENDMQRHLPEWGELLDLGEVHPGPYVTSGLVALGGTTGARTMELLDDRQRRVDATRTVFGERPDPAYPFFYLEQDVLNAVLRTRIEADRITVMPHRLAPNPPFRGLRLDDAGSVSCSYEDGTAPYALHHFGRKPWLEPIYHGLYSRLFARLLLGPEIAIRVPEEMVPLRMRSGARARLERARVDLADVFRRYVLERRRFAR